MSFSANGPSPTTVVSKVTISPFKDSSRGLDALKVTIRKMSSRAEEEKTTSISDADKQNLSTPVGTDHSPATVPEASATISTMTDKPVEISCAPHASQPESQNSAGNAVGGVPVPCVKHAALNISCKARDIPSEKISLCNSCSKSMLSYIFLVQDFLDSLAKEIGGEASPKKCVQCAREELREAIISRDGDSAGDSRSRDAKGHHEKPRDGHDSKHFKHGEEGRFNDKRPHRAKGHRKHDENKAPSRPVTEQEITNRQCQQIDFLYNVSSPSKPHGPKHHDEHSAVDEVQHHRQKHHHEGDRKHHGGGGRGHGGHHHGSDGRHHGGSDRDHPSGDHHGSGVKHYHSGDQHHMGDDGHHHSHDQNHRNDGHHGGSVKDHYREGVDRRHHGNSDRHHHNGKHHESDDQHHGRNGRGHHHDGRDQANEQPQSNEQPTRGDGGPTFIAPTERQQPNYDGPSQAGGSQGGDQENFSASEQIFFGSETDGIVTTLSNVEREVYDTARNGAGWESLSELQERLGASSSGQITSEAFVTSCRNNAEAVGCLVVGTSLLLSRTSRTLCVLVSDGVSTAFKGPLSAVFQVVQYVRSLDSLGTTKLSLLEQPELGITFDKLNVWRLVQFSKCVYLNPDTLVIQNCDELFCHEELSAIPDIGWPDCFNSGVFVFVPSVHTFWQLIEFADKQGSYDGGDQGLLNSYFSSWSYDIDKKLSFIYNLMANVSYTYTPAFRQFGCNVKIVQFHGSFKPWHVKFFPNSGQISPSSPVHPTYVQFVHIWLNIFRISVLRLMSQAIQSYAASQSVICAVEVLRFFPLPSESEAEFFLTPPSVRLRLAERRLQKASESPISEARRRKSAEFLRPATAQPLDRAEPPPEKSEVEPVTDKSATVETQQKNENQTKDEADQEAAEDKESALPGSELGDYQGMKAWEQGRMDYQGTDSSDNIIKRLEFLMSLPDK